MGQRGVQPRRPLQRIPGPEMVEWRNRMGRLVTAARMASLQRRDLRDLPFVLLSDPTVPAVVAETASLIAGEPRRARRIAAPDNSSSHSSDLDDNW